MRTDDLRYSEAILYLNSLIDYERKPDKIRSLEPFKNMLRVLGNPHFDLNCILVAGTKAKGSIASLVATALKNAGAKTGLYLSPHIFEYRERIQIDNIWMSKSEFAEYLKILKNHHSKHRGMRTVFETLTAMAFLYFKENDVEYAVIEVGLGGRLDATNVVNQKVTVFTAIDYDHTNILGNTIQKIAQEKAGVIKNSNPIVSAKQRPSVEKILKKTAQKYHAPLQFLDPSKIVKTESLQSGTRFILNTERPTEVYVPLSGAFQIYNAALATMALSKLGIHDPDFTGVEIPGRFQTINENPTTVVDCAHNPISIRTVLEEVNQRFHPNRLIVVFAVSKDKDVGKMLNILIKKVNILILTEYSNPRSMPSMDLFNLTFKYKKDVKRLVFTDPNKALEEATKLAKHGDVVLVTGSVYLVSDILKNLQGGNHA